MYSCREIGQSRADDILLRIPLRLHEQNTDVKVDSRIRAGEVIGVLKDVNTTCFEYRRENVRRTVCRVSSPSLCNLILICAFGVRLPLVRWFPTMITV